MKKIWLGILIGLVVLGIGIGVWLNVRYRANEVMLIPVEEGRAYPDDPAVRSRKYGEYAGRSLRLEKVGPTTFNFYFESEDPKVATIVFRNVDLSLMVPVQPDWIGGDRDLERIFYTEREWNRQQVAFNADVEGGDGYERENLVSMELVNNSLEAGLWEVLLFVGKGKLLYQGWFRLPLGHYQDLFDRLNPVSYWSQALRLERWSDPTGTPVRLERLREVELEESVPAFHDQEGAVVARGEQAGKRGLVSGDVKQWKDYGKGGVSFAKFVTPGRYAMGEQQGSEYERFAELETIVKRKVKGSDGKPYDELEIVFEDSDTRVVIGGIDIEKLPVLPMDEYWKGLAMPIGISVPPFYQTYKELEKNRPEESVYYALLLDSHDHWLNHREIGIDGAILFRDAMDPNLVHIYLLSYERHALVGHFVITVEAKASDAAELVFLRE
jgi:hypothetical protein